MSVPSVSVPRSVAPIKPLPRKRLALGFVVLAGLIAWIVVTATTSKPEEDKPGILIRKQGTRPGEVVTELKTNFNDRLSIDKSDIDALVDDRVDIVGVRLPKAINVGQEAFKDCVSLSYAHIPRAERIMTSAFQECKSLTEAIFPNVKSIDVGAFLGCSSLVTAIFPRITDIPRNAFSNCGSLVTADFRFVTTIGVNGLKDCFRLDETKDTRFGVGVTGDITGDRVGTSLNRTEAKIKAGSLEFDE